VVTGFPYRIPCARAICDRGGNASPCATRHLFRYHDGAEARFKARPEVTYVELAKRLKKHGFAETEASITNKLKRGTFSATFFLACLAAMELEGVVLEDI
jgi:hypothetical protein